MSTSEWLADCWIDFITEAAELRTQLRRGKVLIRRDRVGQLHVRPGLITAEVKLDNGTVVTVRIRQPVISDKMWKDVLVALARNAGFAAELLQGHLSPGMMEVFLERGVDLYPFDLNDVQNYCSCGSGPACVHAVATHLAFSNSIASAPSLLFTFRGLPQQQLVKVVRKVRSIKRGPKKPKTVKSTSGIEDAAQITTDYWARGAMPSLHFHYDRDEPDVTLHVVRALGAAPGNVHGDAIADVLEPILRVARTRIARLTDAVADLHPGEPEGKRISKAAPRDDRLDDLLVEAAMKRGELTPEFVSEALDVPVDHALQLLGWLVDEGRLSRDGGPQSSRFLPLPTKSAAN